MAQLQVLDLVRANKHEELSKVLSQSPGSSFQMGDDRVSPLYLACWHGYNDCAKVLLEAGGAAAAVDATTRSGWTPLTAACAFGRAACAALLIEHKADVHLEDAEGNTPLMNAAMRGRNEVITLLLRHGADARAQPGLERYNRDRTAAELASGFVGSGETVLLLENAEKAASRRTSLGGLDSFASLIQSPSSALVGRIKTAAKSPQSPKPKSPKAPKAPKAPMCPRSPAASKAAPSQLRPSGSAAAAGDAPSLSPLSTGMTAAAATPSPSTARAARAWVGGVVTHSSQPTHEMTLMARHAHTPPHPHATTPTRHQA